MKTWYLPALVLLLVLVLFFYPSFADPASEKLCQSLKGYCENELRCRPKYVAYGTCNEKMICCISHKDMQVRKHQHAGSPHKCPVKSDNPNKHLHVEPAMVKTH